MKRFFYSLSGMGLVSILMMGVGVSRAQADGQCRPKSPVRGTWSYSQSTLFFYSPLSLFIPSTEVGTATIDACGNLTGHGILNSPDPSVTGSEFDFDGSCVLRANGSPVMDCTFNTLSQKNIREVCVLMEKAGECFQEFRCVFTDGVNEPGTVILAEAKRAQQGTCKSSAIFPGGS